MVVFPLQPATKEIMSKKSKKKSKNVYRNFKNADIEILKGIPQDLLDSSYRKKVQFGYMCQNGARCEMLLTKCFFDNVSFEPLGYDKLVMVNMPITPDYTREHLSVIAEILSCNEIRPCLVVNTFNDNKHIHNFNMTLNVKNSVITPNYISILIQF